MKQVIYFLCLSILIISATSTYAASNNQETVVITGANRGIGLALATQFKKEGYHVIATARKPAKAKALTKLDIAIEQLDITDKQSVKAFANRLNGKPVDILINNAGIGGHATRNFADLDIDKLKTVLDVNSLGALRVTQALLPNIEQSKRKVVASISSRMGSIEQNSSGSVMGYRASKTALNSFNKSLSAEFSSKGFIFVVLHPGWVRTDMTSDQATYSTEESAKGLFKVIKGLNTKDNGKFYDLHGKPISW